MINEAQKILAKAEDAILNAEHDFKGGFMLATANRAYYACYYCMTALLYTQNTYAKTHQGVRAKFSELFIKTAIFPVNLSEDIALIFKNRLEADYDLDADISPEEASSLVKKADDFLKLTRDYFEKLKP